MLAMLYLRGEEGEDGEREGDGESKGSGWHSGSTVADNLQVTHRKTINNAAVVALLDFVYII